MLIVLTCMLLKQTGHIWRPLRHVGFLNSKAISLLLELPSSRHRSMLLWTYCLSLGLASSHSHRCLAFCTAMPGHVLGCRAAGLFDRNQIKAMNYTEKSLHFSMLLSPAHPSPMKSSSLISISRVADGLHFDN
jgi:hypothetical protein